MGGRWQLVALAALLPACTSFTTAHTARPVAPGSVEMMVAPQVISLGRDYTDVKKTGKANTSVPAAELQLRYGLTDNQDLGVKLYMLGIQVDWNWAFVNTHGFALSLNPAVSGMVISGVLLNVWLSLLADFDAGEVVTFTIGPKAGASTVNASFLGGVGAVKLHLSKSFALVPEVDFYRAYAKSLDPFFVWTGALGVAFAW